VERESVERAQRGDRDAFASLVHQVSDALFAVAHRILRDADLAEDALQVALITAWRQLPHLREPDRFEAWLRRLLLNHVNDEYRRHRRQVATIAVLRIEPSHSDASVEETAASLGIPVGTAKSRLHYATEAMRLALEADARPTVREVSA
jgi:RNA polymerase sigma-70 factor (ECF subfamily)